jgi:hypothetical protein
MSFLVSIRGYGEGNLADAARPLIWYHSEARFMEN